MITLAEARVRQEEIMEEIDRLVAEYDHLDMLIRLEIVR